MFDDDNFGGCGGSMFGDSFGSTSSMFDDSSSISSTSMFDNTSISSTPDISDYMYNPAYSWSILSIFHKD